MNNKITKKRLGQLLSYDFWAIIALIVAGVVVWSLLFTMFGDSLSEGQKMNVYAYNVNINENEVYDLLKTYDENPYFSYEIRESSFYNFGGYSSSNTIVSQQFTAWSSVGQLDLIFISSDKTIKSGTDAFGEVVYESLASRFAYSFYDLDAMITDALDYCKTYGGYSDDGTVTSWAAESFFRERKKHDNFYRHGLIKPEQEVDRFRLIWKTAKKMQALRQNEEIDIWYVEEVAEPQDTNGEYSFTTKTYGIDLGKLGALGGNTETGKKPFELCTVGKTDANGNSVADGAVLAAFNNRKYQPDLVYESLAFILEVIETYSDL